MYLQMHNTKQIYSGSKANSVEPRELFYELKLCRFCLDRNEKAGEGRIKRPDKFDWNRREEEGWKCERGREKRVSRCLKTWWKRPEEEMPDSGTRWYEGWDEENQLKHCFPGLERPKQLNTEDRLNQIQGLCQGCMCCDGGCGGFRHLAKTEWTEQL